MLKVLFVFCAIFCTCLATLGSNLEEDNFRMLIETRDDKKVGQKPLEDEEDAKKFLGDGKVSFDLY